MALPLVVGGRLLSSAVSSLMKRYGLKKLEGKASQELAKRGSHSATAKAKRTVKKNARASGLRGKELREFVKPVKASAKEKALATKAARSRDVGLNIAGDAAGAGLSYEMYNSNELEDYIKENKPRVWAKYKKSDYDDIKEYLKAQA